MHVVFDREVYAAIRGQDLGTVRGQPIRPVLAGFGEPFTDWLFQTALQATPANSAFSFITGGPWPFGPGWLLVYALRWMGKSRRIASPDSLVVCHLSATGETLQLSPIDVLNAITNTVAAHTLAHISPTDAECMAARKLAQKILKDCALNRDTYAKGAAGLSLLCAARIEIDIALP
jgi:hypothetical protein